MFLLPCCWTTYPCSAWLVDGVDFLKHIDSSFSGSAEKQMHVSLLVSWDLGQYLATCMCFGWTVNSTCVLYCIRFDYMHMPWWSAAPIVVTCNKSFDSAWMLKNEDTFIQLQFSSSVFDFFFQFRWKKPGKVPFQIYMHVCDKTYQRKAARIHWKWWSYCMCICQLFHTCCGSKKEQ